jgi:hypothetical protein
LIAKLYFDGSGDASTKFIGLAGIAARIEAWDTFEARWAKALAQHGISYSHLADNHTPEILRDLLPIFCELLKDKQTCACMTMVPVQDHKHVCTTYKGSLPSIQCLCVFWCLNEMWQFYPSAQFRVVFDQGESFLHEVKRHWDAKNKDVRLRSITSMETGRMKDTMPLQAVDMYAWEMNRLWSRTYMPEPSNLRKFMNNAPSSLPTQDNPEATSLLLATKTRRWEAADFRHIVECRGASDPESKRVAYIYSLCSKTLPAGLKNDRKKS